MAREITDSVTNNNSLINVLISEKVLANFITKHLLNFLFGIHAVFAGLTNSIIYENAFFIPSILRKILPLSPLKNIVLDFVCLFLALALESKNEESVKNF